MSHRKTRSLVIFTLSSLATTPVWLLQSRASTSETKPTAAGAQRIQDLKVQRRHLLRQCVKAAQLRFERGQGLAADFADLAIQTAGAELELAETLQERIRAYEDLLATLRLCEKRAELLHREGRLIQIEVWQTTVRRLKAEIGLEQAKLAAAPAPATR